MLAVLSETRRSTLVTAGLMLLLLALTFSPVLFGNYTLLPTDFADTMTLPYATDSTAPHANNSLTSDGLFQFYPYKLMLHEAWQHGRFAFWNPLNAGGYPQYAETMGSNFDPLNVILLLAPMPLAFHLYLILPLWIAGIGMYVFIRSYGVDRWIARIFATGYMFCGLFITHLLPHTIPGSFCWVPLSLLFVRRYFERPGPAAFTGASLSLAAAFLGGNIQTSAFVVITLELFVLLYVHPTAFVRRLGLAASITAVALCISAIMWLPTLELFLEVVRHGMLASSSYARSYGVLERLASIPMLATFLLPFLGGPSSGISLYKAINVYTIDYNATLGFFPLLIAAWSMVYFRRSKELRPFLVIASCGFLIPIATPLYHYLYHRFFITSLFALSVIGAVGLDRALSDPSRLIVFDRFISRSSTVFRLLCVCIVAVAAILTIWNREIIGYLNQHLNQQLQATVFSEGNEGWALERIRDTVNNYSLSSVALWVSVLTALIGLAVLGSKKLSRSHQLPLVWGLTAIQCGYFAVWWLAPVSMEQYPILPRTAMTDRLSQTSQRTVFLRRHHSHERYIFIDNENVAYGVNSASIFESLLPRCYHLVLPLLLTDTSAPTNVLRRFNVRYVVTPESSTLPDDAYQLIDSDRVKTWRLRDTSVRAWLAQRSVRVRDDYAAVDSLKTSLLAHAYFSDDAATRIDNSVDSGASVVQVRDEAEALSFKTHSAQASYFVLSDTYYPGWQAIVDGRPSHIYRCNYAMSAVLLPSGDHTVQFTFQPMTFRIGASVSALALLALVASLLIARFRKIKVSRPDDLKSHL